MKQSNTTPLPISRAISITNLRLFGKLAHEKRVCWWVSLNLFIFLREAVGCAAAGCLQPSTGRAKHRIRSFAREYADGRGWDFASVHDLDSAFLKLMRRMHTRPPSGVKRPGAARSRFDVVVETRRILDLIVKHCVMGPSSVRIVLWISPLPAVLIIYTLLVFLLA
ncbi:hypothetical protein F5B21DRAFT_332744 [Xylaria acuta]|nr:hypothetical protein F5B21DRAFT_332744 [Xylaria acuta]